MNLKQVAAQDPSPPPALEEPVGANTDRFLTLLVEGAAQSLPEIDAPSYKEFRETVAEMARQIRDRLPDADKLAILQSILRQFENYRKSAETALRERQNAWRALGSTLLHELLTSMHFTSTSTGAAPLLEKIGNLTNGTEIREYRELLAEFLHPPRVEDDDPRAASPLEIADRTTANDNAAGLRGGGSAVEHLKGIMERSGRGWVVFFRLTCLNIINERFGGEAVQDCLMAVAAYLTHSLRSDDSIYHWSDATLLAIMQGRANQHLLAAELQRIASLNREITIKIGDRTIMLRIPLEFDITPIAVLRDAGDLCKIAQDRARAW